MTAADRSAARFWWTVAAAAAVALVARLAFAIDYAEEVDSIRFLLALDDFDVAAHRPHFPGYPVYIALGRLLYAITGDPVTALALLGALSGALLVIPVAVLARSLYGDRAGCWAAALVAVNPLLWLFSEKLLSDMPGLLLLLSSLAVLAKAFEATDPPRRTRLLAAAFALLGLTLGARLSYFPFAVSAFALAVWRCRAVVVPIAAGAAGALCWFVPLVLDAGWHELVHTASVQGGGHFTRWGGTVVTHSDYAHRASMLVWEVGAQGLGTWWTDRTAAYLIPTGALLLLLALAASRRRLPRPNAAIAVAVLAVPYLVWVFFGQNITVKARHALPLVALATLVVAGAIARATAAEGSRRLAPALAGACAAVLLAAHAASGWSLAREHRATPSNAVRLARELGHQCREAPAGRPVVLYTASLQRHVERHAPCVELVVLRRSTQVARDLAERDPATIAFVASDVARLDRLELAPVLTLRRNRYVQNARHELALYRIRDRRPQGGRS